MTVFIRKGDKPLSIRQATTRGTQTVSQELGIAGARAGDESIFGVKAHKDLPARLLSVLAALPGNPSTYSEYAAQWELSNETNSANNLFNHQLAAYVKYSQRLARYRLVEGREQVLETRETGDYTDAGVAVMETTITSPAVDPLPAQVERIVMSDELGEAPQIEMVDNPAVVADETERATAQYVISQLPVEVVDFFDAMQ